MTIAAIAFDPTTTTRPIRFYKTTPNLATNRLNLGCQDGTRHVRIYCPGFATNKEQYLQSQQVASR